MKKVLFQLIYPIRNLLGRYGAIMLQYLDNMQYLKNEGLIIGKDCRLLTRHFGSEPYLIEIGDHVSVGANVQLITHDGGVWVLRYLCNEPRLDLFGKIKIGNNVFIGNNSIILPNVTIGDNVIVAAGSVVTRDIRSNTIAGGVPAKELGAINDYMTRRREQCILTKDLSGQLKKNAILSELR